MPPPLLSLRNVRLGFGSEPLFDGLEMHIFERDRVGLVGRNGSGKSTLMKIAAGLMEPDEGERFVQPGASVRYLEQEPDLSGYESVREAVEAGLAPGEDTGPARALIDRLGLTGAEDPAHLSGGEARRAALARALAPDPDVILLDEPTNHLDIQAIEWLEGVLSDTRAAMVLISHDRRLLSDLTRRTVWIDRGVARDLDRGFAHFEAWRDQVLEEEEQERHKLDRKIVAEEHWVRYGVTARRKRNVRRMKELDGLRSQRREATARPGNAVMAATEGRRSGKLVIDADAISKSFGERVIVQDVSVRVRRGDRLGLAAPNGAGKTTLVRLLTGALAPDSGTVTLGANVDMVVLDQQRATLSPDVTVKDTLTEGGGDHVVVGDQSRHVIGYMKDFLFAPEQARSPVGSLSGGERGRLLLAVALAKPSNLLVLDEPTNDLDLETLDLLQELLADYPGTVILVSHDRDFLDRVATSTVTLDPSAGPGAWREYPGGYSDMRRQAQAETDPTSGENPASKTTSQPRAGKVQTKLSYKDQRALEQLPKDMARLEREITDLQVRLADPDLFAKDPAAFDTAAKALDAARSQLESAEEEWLSLEIRREEFENAGKA